MIEIPKFSFEKSNLNQIECIEYSIWSKPLNKVDTVRFSSMSNKFELVTVL